MTKWRSPNESANRVLPFGLVIPSSFDIRHSAFHTAPCSIFESFANNQILLRADWRFAAVVTKRRSMNCSASTRSEERRVGKECRAGWWGGGGRGKELGVEC